MLFDELGRPVRRQAAVVRHIELQKTASLAAGTSEMDDYTVPAGRSWLGRRLTFYIEPPPGATAGNHSYGAVIPSTIFRQATRLVIIAFGGLILEDVDLPNLAVASARILQLRYSNGTNVAQTNPRSWHVTIIEEIS